MIEDLLLCPLCKSTHIQIRGYRGLGLSFVCLDCATRFTERMSLENDLMQAEQKALGAENDR